jgi:hypothetical protein
MGCDRRSGLAKQSAVSTAGRRAARVADAGDALGALYLDFLRVYSRYDSSSTTFRPKVGHRGPSETDKGFPRYPCSGGSPACLAATPIIKDRPDVA